MAEDIDLNTEISYLYVDADLVGLGDGVHAVIAIRQDGTPWPWLIDTDHRHRGGNCCHNVVPAHERLGRLPAAARARINRCQGFTSTGHRDCSRAIPIGETACYQHRPKDGG